MKKTTVRPKNKIVIYTAIFGGVDDLKNPATVDKDCDYVCFTDDPSLKSSLFSLKVVPGLYADPVRSARLFKILPQIFLEKYTYSLWIDANMVIKNSLTGYLIEKYLDHYDLATFRHPYRDCIYDEAKACLGLNKDYQRIIEKQMREYRRRGYPEHNGLISGGVLLRRHNSPRMKQFSNEWWKECARHSKRDQLSFNYVAWRDGFPYAIMDGDIENNRLFELVGHNREVGTALSDRDNELVRLKEELRMARTQLTEQSIELTRLRREIDLITGTRAWRLVKKARKPISLLIDFFAFLTNRPIR